jgi:hypothetical protein
MLYKKIFLVSLLMGGSLFAAAPALADGIGSSVSANWAGYVADATNTTYTGVVGSWNVPVPTSTSASMATDATWVGIGGVKSTDLIQAGTQAIVQNGSITYQAWYELLPAGQQVIPLTVHGGDSVTVSFAETSTNRWHLSFIDNTTGGDYEKDISYTSSLSSADWIEEMPVLEQGRSSTYLPLDNFGTVNFTGGYTVANGSRESIAQAGAQSLTMAASGGRQLQALAAPSILADDAFSVSRSSVQIATTSQPSMRVAVNTTVTSNTRTWRRGGRQITVFVFQR